MCQRTGRDATKRNTGFRRWMLGLRHCAVTAMTTLRRQRALSVSNIPNICSRVWYFGSARYNSSRIGLTRALLGVAGLAQPQGVGVVVLARPQFLAVGAHEGMEAAQIIGESAVAR
jgi:hypothetical protein